MQRPPVSLKRKFGEEPAADSQSYGVRCPRHRGTAAKFHLFDWATVRYRARPSAFFFLTCLLVFHRTGIFLAYLGGARSSFLPAQEAFQSTKNSQNQVRHLRAAPSLPSTHILVQSPTPCSDHPSGHSPHIDETTKMAFIVLVSRGMTNHCTPLSPPPSRPCRVRIATTNSKLHHIHSCNTDLHTRRWPPMVRSRLEGNMPYDVQRFVSVSLRPGYKTSIKR